MSTIRELMEITRRRARMSNTIATSEQSVFDAVRDAYRHYVNKITASRPDAMRVLYVDLVLTEEFTALPDGVDLIVRVEDMTSIPEGRGGPILPPVPLESADVSVRACYTLVGRRIGVGQRAYDGRTLRIYYRPDIESWDDLDLPPLLIPHHFHEALWRRAVIDLIGIDGEPTKQQQVALHDAETNAMIALLRQHPPQHL